MKSLTLLVAGFGVILLAGCWENSVAEEESSILAGNSQFVDSSKTLSLQDRAERNFDYIKAGPADPGKVAGELLVGTMGAVAGGTIGAGLGFRIGSDSSGGFFDEGGFIGALVGYMVLSNLGCATGVCLVGNSGGEKGSFGSSLGGSLLGTLAGGLYAGVIAGGSEDDSGALPLFIICTAQSAGATLCFNATKKQKVELPSGAILKLKDGTLALSLPQVSVSQDAFNSNCYQINFFEASF